MRGTLRRLASLSHVDASTARPRMVDVGGKAVTARRAVASCRVVLPAGAWDELSSSGFASKKGPVLTTAVIAGVQGAKRTHELVPFCHSVARRLRRRLRGRRRREGPGHHVQRRDVAPDGRRDGGAHRVLGGGSRSTTCKALSHDIEITNLRLLGVGGKADFKRG
ncbi:cyclic pyranopterin monophosphate synthase [Aureococcus anophagefferens]|nr:cyclic pyranopterin monophosphate synthase [Aureococcus anophagefferens]